MKRFFMLTGIFLVFIVLSTFLGCASTPAPPPAPTIAPTPTGGSTTAPAPKPSSSPSPVATAAKLTKFNIAYQGSPTANYAILGIQPWLKQVEQATNGRITFEVYYSQTLCKAADTWNAVSTGIADMAFVGLGSFPGVTPLSDVMTLAFVPFDSNKQASGVFWKLYEKYPSLQSEYKAVRLVMPYDAVVNHLICSKKQIKTLEDFKGLKMRVASDTEAEQYRLMGCIPINITAADAYMSLQKGVVDATISNWDFTTGFRIYEVGKYFTNASMATSTFACLMNNDKWNSLPKDVQDVFSSKGGLYGAEFFGFNVFDNVVQPAKESIKKQGYEIIEYTPPQQEIQKWIDVSGKAVWDKWIKQNEAKGHPEAKDILNSELDLIKTYKP
jgi:TRAP-type transport system periplasmic protein